MKLDGWKASTDLFDVRIFLDGEVVHICFNIAADALYLWLDRELRAWLGWALAKDNVHMVFQKQRKSSLVHHRPCLRQFPLLHLDPQNQTSARHLYRDPFSAIQYLPLLSLCCAALLVFSGVIGAEQDSIAVAVFISAPPHHKTSARLLYRSTSALANTSDLTSSPPAAIYHIRPAHGLFPWQIRRDHPVILLLRCAL